jgi:hypothetical protein
MEYIEYDREWIPKRDMDIYGEAMFYNRKSGTESVYCYAMHLVM